MREHGGVCDTVSTKNQLIMLIQTPIFQKHF